MHRKFLRAAHHAAALCAALILPLLPASGAQAVPIDITHTGANVIGAALFEITVTTPFFSDGFLGASGGMYSFEMPGSWEQGRLEARLDGVWTQVAATSVAVSGTESLAAVFGPKPFTPGLVDGLRLWRLDGDAVSSCNFYGGCWRNMNGVSFTFNEIAALNEVPEPASLALFGTGLAGLGLLRRRRGMQG
jgi:PEP-CTERM motif